MIAVAPDEPWVVLDELVVGLDELVVIMDEMVVVGDGFLVVDLVTHTGMNSDPVCVKEPSYWSYLW